MGPPLNKPSTSIVFACHLLFLLIKPRVTQHAVVVISEYVTIFYFVCKHWQHVDGKIWKATIVLYMYTINCDGDTDIFQGLINLVAVWPLLVFCQSISVQSGVMPSSRYQAGRSASVLSELNHRLIRNL